MARPTPLSLANPAIDPPHVFSSPSKRQSFHSRSRSRSPIRPYAQARDFDPLLRDLSPTTTLHAFSFGLEAGAGNENVNPRHSFITSLDSSTASQRALGARAAQACLDVRSWARELEAWEWPGTFDVPEPARKRQRMSVLSIGSLASKDPWASEDAGEGDDDFWGSLPARTVQSYEERLEEVGLQLDEVDVEELKRFILAAHKDAGIETADIDDSIGAIGAVTDLRRLDDFTAVITATIMQALPYLSRLNQLLDTWNIRTAVLRKTPPFLKSLKQAITDLDHGWAAIAIARPRDEGGVDRASFTRESMFEMQEIVERSVKDLGRRLDGFLDDLEGREETVPESWIEDLELLEEKYAQWTVRAEMKAFENEMRSSRLSLLLPTETDAEDVTHINDAEVSHPVGSKESSLVDDSTYPGLTTGTARAVSPIEAGTSTWEDRLTSFSSPAELLEQRFPSTLVRDESGALQGDQASRIIGDEPSSIQSSPKKYENPRHVPIVISHLGDGQEYPSEGITGFSASFKPLPENDLPVVTQANQAAGPTTASEPPARTVKQRAAFLVDVSRTDSLQKNTKSPVRPFEHASNAFTRLFKKDGPVSDRSRSNSLGRSKSVKSDDSRRRSSSIKDIARSFGGKAEDGVVWGGRGPASPVRSASKKDNGSKRDSGSLKAVVRSRSRTPEASPVRAASDAPPVPILPKSASQSANASARTSTEIAPAYQPTVLLPPFEENQETSKEAPAHGFDFGENWPLVSPEPSPEPLSPVKEVATQDATQGSADGGAANESEPESSSPEIASPKKPMRSDAFDRMFVETFPLPPTERPTSPSRRSLSPSKRLQDPLGRSESAQRQMRAASPSVHLSGVPTLEESMLGDLLGGDTEAGLESDTRVKSVLGSLRSDRSAADTKSSNLPFPEFKPEDFENAPGSEDSNVMSTDDVGYVHAVSSDQPASARDSPAPGVPLSHKYSPKSQTEDIGYFPLQDSPGVSRRSSNAMASTDNQDALDTVSAIPAQLRLSIPPSNGSSIQDMVTQGSDTQAEESPSARPPPLNRASMASIESHPRSELKSVDVRRRSSSSLLQNMPVSPRDAAVSPASYRNSGTFPSPPAIRELGSRSPVSPLDDSPGPTRRQEFTPSPLASFAQPQSSPERDLGDLNNFMAKRRGQASGTTKPLPGNRKSQVAEGDAFDRHVSEVLERIPAPIRFRSGAQTSNARTSEPRNYSGPRPKTARVPSRAASGALTLAPADPTPKRTNTASNEPEVKLYHLTQAGREEPIKLFVRLVGEGERVMVRVGGGWADLAEYLRQYAEHHGSRTVSDGNMNLNVQSASTPSGPGRRVSGSTIGAARTPATPAPPGSRAGSEAPNSPEMSPPMPPPTYTPSRPPSRPSTSGTSHSKSSSSRPGSRQAWSDVGMAGPGAASTPGSGKKPELDEHKAKWVEGMMERVQKASTEKSKEDKDQSRKLFGELGKVGGTRRVIFKNGGAGKEGE